MSKKKTIKSLLSKQRSIDRVHLIYYHVYEVNKLHITQKGENNMAAEKLTEQINDVKDAMTLFKEMTQQEKEQILMFMSGMKAAKELYQAGQTPA